MSIYRQLISGLVRRPRTGRRRLLVQHLPHCHPRQARDPSPVRRRDARHLPWARKMRAALLDVRQRQVLAVTSQSRSIWKRSRTSTVRGQRRIPARVAMSNGAVTEGKQGPQTCPHPRLARRILRSSKSSLPADWTRKLHNGEKQREEQRSTMTSVTRCRARLPHQALSGRGKSAEGQTNARGVWSTSSVALVVTVSATSV